MDERMCKALTNKIYSDKFSMFTLCQRFPVLLRKLWRMCTLPQGLKGNLPLIYTQSRCGYKGGNIMFSSKETWIYYLHATFSYNEFVSFLL